MDNLIAPLLRLPIFAELKPLQLTGIVHRAERQKFWPGDIITKAGEPADGAYLIVSGPAQRVAGPGLTTTVAEPVVPGSLIGEMAMLVEHDYGSTIVARDRVFCLKLLRETMHAQMREDPTLAEHFHGCLTERLLRTAARAAPDRPGLGACSCATATGACGIPRCNLAPLRPVTAFQQSPVAG